MTDLLNAALKYARNGRAVFPCGPNKAPRLAGGFKAATTDEKILRSFELHFRDGTLGAIIPEGQIVVDIDPRNGGDTTIELMRLQGELPPTKTVKTRSGGTHLYYKVDPALELRGSLGPGVDIKRADKGYVIVPPSEGYEYLKHNVIVPVPAPQWLIDELVVEPKDESESQPSPPKFFEAFEQGTPYGVKAMESELGRLATAVAGERNNTLNRAAFSLAQLASGGELSHDVAIDKLTAVAVNLGLEPEEIDKTIESGWSAGEQEPRQAPEDSMESTFPAVAETLGDPEAEGRFWVNWQVDEAPPPFFLHPMLPQNAYVLVYGATEAAKSMTLLGILSEGSHRAVRSSIYSLENPPATDRDRLRRWAPDPETLRMTHEPLDFNDPRQVEKLIERERAWGTNVVVIDTYSHAFNSRSDDGNAKAIEFARRVRYVMASVGCSVVVVDHTGYMQDIDPRDASAKRQQVDVAILMKKKGDWVFGQPARFSMKNHKSARFANPFYLEGEIRDVKDRGLELVWTTGDAPKWEKA